MTKVASMSTAERQLHCVRKRVKKISIKDIAKISKRHVPAAGWVIPPDKSLGARWDSVATPFVVARTMRAFTKGVHDSKLLGKVRRNLLICGKHVGVKPNQVDMACFMFFGMRAFELRRFFRVFCTHSSRRGIDGAVDWHDVQSKEELLVLLDELAKVSKVDAPASARLYNALLLYHAPSAFFKHIVKRESRPSSATAAASKPSSAVSAASELRELFGSSSDEEDKPLPVAEDDDDDERFVAAEGYSSLDLFGAESDEDEEVEQQAQRLAEEEGLLGM